MTVQRGAHPETTIDNDPGIIDLIERENIKKHMEGEDYLREVVNLTESS